LILAALLFAITWNDPVEPFRITDNLYYVGASDLTSFLITTPEGHIVIDGGFESTAPMILANIRKLGFRVEDVKFILNSHAHYDHAGGIPALKKATGATFVAGRRDAPQLARGGLGDPHFGDKYPFPPIVPDRLVDDDDTVTLGGITVVAHATPGHTPGCTTWTATLGGHEVVFVGSPSVPSEYKLTPRQIDDYRAQFRTLHALHPDIFLGSHGSFFGLAEKMKTHNFVDPGGYRAFVDAMEAAFVRRTTIVIHNATVIDGTGAPPRPNADIVIREGRIASIEATKAPREGASVIDATGKYVIPGLIDMHAHVVGLEPRFNRKTTLPFLRTLLRFGVTTVRDPGAITSDAIVLRRMLQDGEVEGPRLFTAGRILNSSNFNPEPFVIVRDEAQVRDEIRWQAKAGVDVIKVYSSMPPNLVAVAIDEAHKHGLPVIGHVHRTTWTEAARMGIDGVEHAAPWSDAYATGEVPNSLFGRAYWLEHLDAKAIDEMIDSLVEHHVVVDPTLMAMRTKFWGDVEHNEVELVPESVRKKWTDESFTKDWTPEQYAAAKKSWPLLLALEKKMFDRGVEMVVGTDTPTPWIVPGASVHDEMTLLSDAGIPPPAILRMATFNAARALRSEKEFGSIRAGLRADLVVLSKNPLESIANTRAIDVVIQNGIVLTRSQ